MDRTIPSLGSDEIQLYMRTYYSLLRSSDSIAIETLVESHKAMNSSLHQGALAFEPDISALMYTAIRLPSCMDTVKDVVVGQISRSVTKVGYEGVTKWERVYAPGRRRRMHYDGDGTLMMFVISRSDIDDIIPILVAYQIEWNKLHVLLQDDVMEDLLRECEDCDDELRDDLIDQLADTLRLSADDVRRLEVLWKDNFAGMLRSVRENRKEMTVRMISGSMVDYRRVTSAWWRRLSKRVSNQKINLDKRRVYFVSSNTHSLVNLLTGFAHRYEDTLVDFIETRNREALLAEYADIRHNSHALSNFLYFTLKDYLSEHPEVNRFEFQEESRSIGIHRVPNKKGFEIEGQVIEINKLHREWLDPRLQDIPASDTLNNSQAIILNIDYPLGMAAYEIMSRVGEGVGELAGVYIMGKSATLNGRIGDVMIPNVVHDEHSQNTYIFNNCFNASHVRPYMQFGNVLDNQKAVTVLGTFLQNPQFMSVFYHEGYCDIEMEAGPYLSAVYEAFRPKRHPVNEIVNLHGVQFDVGFLHYASDTPMSGHNLGMSNLNYVGVEPTYATAVAILRRIFQQEIDYIRETQARSEKVPSK